LLINAYFLRIEKKISSVQIFFTFTVDLFNLHSSIKFAKPRIIEKMISIMLN